MNVIRITGCMCMRTIATMQYSAWKELVDHNLPFPSNGRVCGIQIRLSEESCINVYGVYMPSNGSTEQYQYVSQTCMGGLDVLRY